MPRLPRSEAKLIYSASETDANMLWATHFFAPDPFLFVQKGSRRYLVMNDLEIDRAKQQASVDRVLPLAKYVRRLQRTGTLFPRAGELLVEVLQDLRISSVDVPANFPIGLADRLRRAHMKVRPQPEPFWTERQIKTPEEVENIKASLRAAESGMRAGIEAVRRSRVGRNGYLYLDGTQLTSEILKSIINTTIMSQGYVPSHTIAASGEQCVDPHNEGSGRIRAGTSIIMDIFPRCQRTGYFGDITRTVVRGRAPERLKRAYECVRKGQEIAFRRIRHGADAVEIHRQITDYFSQQGFATGRLDGRMQGFFHGTGHGLGLDIHELPGLGSRSQSILKTGHVVTVEPGLYYSGMGGVRLEDVVLVEETGCTNLVHLPKILEV